MASMLGLCFATERKKGNGGGWNGLSGGPGGVLAKVHSSGGRTRRVSGVKGAGHARSDLVLMGALA